MSCVCRNCRDEERENMNCGNQVAQNGRGKKKNCGNQVVENEGKKKERCYVHNIFTSFSQQITSG